MNTLPQRKTRRQSSLIAALALTMVTAGLLLSSPESLAQQDRQLVQTGSNASNGKRVALVIGNSAYQNAKPLKNPANDATVMAASLRALGFEVVSGVNLTQREMKQKMREFGRRLRAQGGVGVFYYAGHGVQAKGHNYLVPVDAEVQSEADMEDAAVDMNYILALMDDAQNTLNIVILDACRNNPFSGRSFRSTADGLAQVKAPSGTLIAYATAPDNTASDGPGQNGLYTEELLKTMKVPGVLVETMFRRVAEQVSARTSGKQEPWFSANVKGDFYFKAVATDASGPTTRSRPNATLADANTVEAEYWESIRESNDKTDFQDYLKEYPQGRYAPLARVKLRQLEGASKPNDGKPNNVGAGNAGIASGAANTTGNTTGGARPVLKPGAVVKNQMGVELVYVPPGSFMMGSTNDSNEKPVHEVTINYSFYMGKYEVTQAQWQAVMGNNPSNSKGDNLPVETVSWDDAIAFIARLNLQNDGYSYRLPSEAEWEYACRAGTTTAFAFGDSLSSDQANFDGNYPYGGAGKGVYRQKTIPVGSFQPNAFGLYDMHGNVWEWCQDWYHDSYSGAPTDGSAWASGGEQIYRVMRGGSWDFNATFLGSAHRSRVTPDHRYDLMGRLGFRVVAVVRTQ